MRLSGSVVFVTAIALMLVDPCLAQPGPQHRWGKGAERLEKYKKMRLIEILDLKEEEAVRFVAKYSAHEDSMRVLMNERMGIIDELEIAIRSKLEEVEMQKLFAKLEGIEQKKFNERRRFHDEIKKSLTAEQAAKFFVFDRNFNRELRKAMDEMRRRR